VPEAGAAEEKPKPKRTRAKAAASTAEKPKRATRAKAAASTAEKPKRATRARTPKQDVDAERSIAEAVAATPRRRAKPKGNGDRNGATPLERASNAVRDAVRDAKPTAPAGDEAA
jgi:hypothetical protein